MNSNHFIAKLSKDEQHVIIDGENKEIAEAYKKNFQLFVSMFQFSISPIISAISSKNINEKGGIEFYNYVASKIKLDKSTGKYSAKIGIKNTRFGKGKLTVLKTDSSKDE